MTYPVLERDFTRESYIERGKGPILTTAMMDWFWNHAMRTEADADDPYLAPIKAKDLSGLPPALVITAEYDVLRDEGAAYAKRLKEAGVPTVHTDYAGVPHGFSTMWYASTRVRRAWRRWPARCAGLRDGLAMPLDPQAAAIMEAPRRPRLASHGAADARAGAGQQQRHAAARWAGRRARRGPHRARPRREITRAHLLATRRGPFPSSPTSMAVAGWWGASRTATPPSAI